MLATNFCYALFQAIDREQLSGVVFTIVRAFPKMTAGSMGVFKGQKVRFVRD